MLVDDLGAECRAAGVELCTGVEPDVETLPRGGIVVLTTGAVPDRPAWAVTVCSLPPGRGPVLTALGGPLILRSTLSGKLSR